MHRRCLSLLLLAPFLLLLSGCQTTPPAKASIQTHMITSPYQKRPVAIQVLPPSKISPLKRYRTLYMLPVESDFSRFWGNALAIARQQELADRFNVFCVYPTFDDMPWYADHPDQPQNQQESHLIKVVLPFMESQYPVMKHRDGRYLVGFSKSGWGACSLLLRNPHLFAKAAAWDSPLINKDQKKFKIGRGFGSKSNYLRYHVPSLLNKRAPMLRNQNARLIFTGYDHYREEMRKIHEKCSRLGIPHVYRNHIEQEHEWQGGWLPETTALLLSTDR